MVRIADSGIARNVSSTVSGVLQSAERQKQRRRHPASAEKPGAFHHVIDAEGLAQAGEDGVRQAAGVKHGAAAARPVKELCELPIDLPGLEDHRQVQADARGDERLQHLLGVVERPVEAGVREDDRSGAAPL